MITMSFTLAKRKTFNILQRLFNLPTKLIRFIRRVTCFRIKDIYKHNGQFIIRNARRNISTRRQLGMGPSKVREKRSSSIRSVIQPHVIPYESSTLHQPQRRTVIEIVSLQYSSERQNLLIYIPHVKYDKKYHIRSQVVFSYIVIFWEYSSFRRGSNHF